MSSLSIHRDGWLESEFDDLAESMAMTRLRVSVGNTILTRNFSKRGGGESEAINVSLLPLAKYIASGWWALMYEPLRHSEGSRFQARHRLDMPMHGFVFPPIAICSAGDEAVTVDWGSEDPEHSPVEFSATRPDEPLQIDRTSAEVVLMDLVEAVLERVPPAKSSELYASWSRVRETLENPNELAYCELAGRLGLDPYDPDHPDLSDITGRVSPRLLEDVAEAANVTELPEVTDWIASTSKKLLNCPMIEISAFGPSPIDEVQGSAGIFGFHAAKTLRQRLRLDAKPKKAVAELLGDAVNWHNGISERGPAAITALTERKNGQARIGAVASTARQQRFRACTGAYLAWVDDTQVGRAGTIAHTRRQQASRAFAAEILAPQEVLLERAGPYGFTSDEIESQASDLICPYDAVLWQSVRAGIPLRGIDTDPVGTMRVFSS